MSETSFIDFCYDNKNCWPQCFENDLPNDKSLVSLWDVTFVPKFFIIDSRGVVIHMTSSLFYLKKKIELLIKMEI